MSHTDEENDGFDCAKALAKFKSNLDLKYHKTQSETTVKDTGIVEEEQQTNKS